MGVTGGRRSFFNIAHIQHGLAGDQLQPRHGFRLAGGNGRARRLAGLERRDQGLHQRYRGDAVPVAATRLLLHGGEAALQAVQIGQHELGFHDFGIADGVHAAFHVSDVAILEAAQHVNDGVGFADIGQELVAQSLAAAGATHQAGDVYEFQAGGDGFLRLADRGQDAQPWIGHTYAAYIRLDRAEWVISCLRGGSGG